MTITATQQAQEAANRYVAAQLKDDPASKPFHAAITAANETKAAIAHKRKQLEDLKQLTPLGVENSMKDMEQAATKQFATLRERVQQTAEKLVADNTPEMPKVNAAYADRMGERYHTASNSGRREMLLKAIGGDTQLAAALVAQHQEGFVEITPVMVQQLRNIIAPAPELDETASMRLQLAQIANNALSL